MNIIQRGIETISQGIYETMAKDIHAKAIPDVSRAGIDKMIANMIASTDIQTRSKRPNFFMCAINVWRGVQFSLSIRRKNDLYS